MQFKWIWITLGTATSCLLSYHLNFSAFNHLNNIVIEFLGLHHQTFSSTPLTLIIAMPIGALLSFCVYTLVSECSTLYETSTSDVELKTFNPAPTPCQKSILEYQLRQRTLSKFISSAVKLVATFNSSNQSLTIQAKNDLTPDQLNQNYLTFKQQAPEEIKLPNQIECLAFEVDMTYTWKPRPFPPKPVETQQTLSEFMELSLSSNNHIRSIDHEGTPLYPCDGQDLIFGVCTQTLFLNTPLEIIASDLNSKSFLTDIDRIPCLNRTGVKDQQSTFNSKIFDDHFQNKAIPILTEILPKDTTLFKEAYQTAASTMINLSELKTSIEINAFMETLNPLAVVAFMSQHQGLGQAFPHGELVNCFLGGGTSKIHGLSPLA